jgi:hypothetical protein
MVTEQLQCQVHKAVQAGFSGGTEDLRASHQALGSGGARQAALSDKLWAALTFASGPGVYFCLVDVRPCSESTPLYSSPKVTLSVTAIWPVRMAPQSHAQLLRVVHPGAKDARI